MLEWTNISCPLAFPVRKPWHKPRHIGVFGDKMLVIFELKETKALVKPEPRSITSSSSAHTWVFRITDNNASNIQRRNKSYGKKYVEEQM